jgi:TonB family protein
MARSSDMLAARLAGCAARGLVALALTFALPALSHAAKPTPPPAPAPAPDFPSGCEPDLLRARLASVDSADVARACGNLRIPWGYRGRIGRELAMRSYGRRTADGAWARRLAETLVESATVDTIYRAPAVVVSCKPTETPPIYLVRLHQGGDATSVLLRFDLGVATVFADEAPLGLIVLGERSDSLWALLGRALEDDPAFRDPPPAPKDSLFTIPQVTGEAISVDSAPLVMGRIRETPPYPEAARRQGVEGTVHVLARVDTFGRVEDAVVHAGPAPLRDVALETVWGVRFTAARVAGKAVAAWTMVPLQFRAK